MKNYDSNEVSCIAMGIPVETGRGDEAGKFIEIDALADAFVDTLSLDGEVSRSKTNDDRADITITIMSTSATNALFSALHLADKLAANGAGVGPLLIKDRQGLSLFAAAEAWIVRPPKREFGQKAVPLEWKIRAAKLNRFEGGN